MGNTTKIKKKNKACLSRLLSFIRYWITVWTLLILDTIEKLFKMQ